MKTDQQKTKQLTQMTEMAETHMKSDDQEHLLDFEIV